MQIFLTENCTACTGSIGRGFGYHIQRRKNGFFGKRNAKGSVPPDGHLRFIFTAAEIARYRLHIADIRVSGKELVDAVTEAGKFCPAYDPKRIFNAAEVLAKRDALSL